MPIKTNVYKLNDILSRTNDELVGNWSRLASLIKNFEKMEWRVSQQLASQLIKDGKAKAYVEKVRKEVSSTQKKTVSKKIQSTSKKKKKKTKVIPINTKRDRFSMNYKRLLEIAPDLIEQLESGEHIYGKSQRSGYMDFNLELIDSDKTGYYLAISHYFKQNGDLVPDPDMQILVSVDRETVEALTIQNQWYFKEVYDNMFNRKMVRLNEKKAQNTFLEQWFKNLIAQEHLIEWGEEDENKPDISYMDEKVTSPLKYHAQNIILDDAIRTYRQHEKGEIKIRPIILFFTVERLNDSPIGSDFSYPSAKELKEDYEKILDFNANNDRSDQMIGSKKTDLSFLPKELIEAFRKAIEEVPIEEVNKTYASYAEKEKKLNPLALYFVIEKLNKVSPKKNILYPSEAEMKSFFKGLKPENYDKVFSELTAEIVKTINKKEILDPKIFGKNYKKLLKIAPNLLERLEEHGTELMGRSEKADLLYDFVLKVPDKDKSTYCLLLTESGYINKKLEEYTAMEIHFDPISKEVFALLTYLQNGKIDKVFENVQTLEGVNIEQKNKQNNDLSIWLDELLEKGHIIDEWLPKNKSAEKSDKPAVKKKSNRFESVAKNEFFKTNFQKLIRLVPTLFELGFMSPITLTSTKKEVFIDVIYYGEKGKFVKEYQLVERSAPFKKWTVMVQGKTKKVVVKSFENGKKQPIKKENNLFGKWLGVKLKEGYKFNKNPISILFKKYPIIIQWAEGSEDENIGLESLEALEEKLKTYEVQKKDNGYTKVKVWFKDHEYPTRIDLSETKGDYDPFNQKLIDWLESIEPKVDWKQFQSKKERKEKPKKTRKELQKEANIIPDFEIGKVKLVAAHIKAGIKQKHIDFINKHRQGMTVIPANDMVNKTKSFKADASRKALKPGFRISATGKLYYETRSNRSDLGSTL